VLAARGQRFLESRGEVQCPHGCETWGRCIVGPSRRGTRCACSQPAPGEALHGRDQGLGLPAWGGCPGRYMQATGAKDGIAFSYGGMISNTMLSHCVVEMAWDKGGAVLQDAVVRV
jgi:hypothetical protein